jgi:predicted nucleic acid-binding Zn ribbon protein
VGRRNRGGVEKGEKTCSDSGREVKRKRKRKRR